MGGHYSQFLLYHIWKNNHSHLYEGCNAHRKRVTEKGGGEKRLASQLLIFYFKQNNYPRVLHSHTTGEHFGASAMEALE